MLERYGDYGFYRPRGRVLQSWTYTYIRNRNGIDFAGSLSENTGYTVFEYYQRKHLRVVKDCKGLHINSPYDVFDLFVATGEENQVFDSFFGLMNLPKPKIGPCTGWTSWYNYYSKISEDVVLDNLAAFCEKSIPIDVFQIDDGYQNAVGDWLVINPKFPQGMKYMASEIKKCGYKAGLWLAPFACEKRSELYQNHPEWIVTKAGYNPGWKGYFYALDFYNPEVRAYLTKVFRVVFEEWGYDLVKLDFLYAAALQERKDKTRGQIMHEAMTFLRELAGDKLILGCGVPLGSAFGLVDYCRIGSDVALSWEDRFLRRVHYRERVSTINSLTSTIGRRHLNGRGFYNDPDVFVLRSSNNQFIKEQRHTLFLLNRIYGSVLFTSDNINEYTSEEMAMYRSLFPLVPSKIRKVNTQKNLVKTYFSVGNDQYLVVSNLGDKKTNFITENECVSKGQGLLPKGAVVTLNPYQSICFIYPKPGVERLSGYCKCIV